MSIEHIFVYAGKRSQTGNAFNKEYPGVSFDEEDSSDFEGLHKHVTESCSLAVLPLWNSYQGEIPKTRVLENIFNSHTRIQELWPQKITFELIAREHMPKESLRSVASVFVAETQCSSFLKGRSFKKYNSTRIAYDSFKTTKIFDCVLCAPGQNEQFAKLDDDVSNPMNFTTFVIIGDVNEVDFNGSKWEECKEAFFPKRNNIFGVEMPLMTPTLTEEQNDFFTNLTNQASMIDDIPRIIFIYKQNPTKFGMLFETLGSIDGLSLDENGGSEVLLKEGLGRTKNSYANRVIKFISETFPEVAARDFYRHNGAYGCFYCCPILNILISGYEPELTEAITRITINNYFELIDKGLECTTAQKAFFDKYKSEYYKKGKDFINFIQVN
jgi:hypothetical protein